MLAQPMTTPEGTQLAQLRLASEGMIVGMIGLHGPVVLVVGWLTGQNWIAALALWAVLAGAAALAHRSRPGTPETRMTVATALCAMPALLVLELVGHPWQPDVHMHFFAVLAVSAALLDFRAIVAGAALVAVHHLALNLVVPALLFPGGGDLGRVLLHAVVLVFEATALAWVTHRAAGAIAAAEVASDEIARLAELRTATEAAARTRASAERRDALLVTAAELDRALSGIVASLGTSSGTLSASSDALSVSAGRTSERATASAAACHQASASVQTVAAAAEEMNVTVGEITQRVAETATAAHRTLEEVQATDVTVQEMAEGAQRIGDVVRMISAIAAQTNLLALNATIEAARAGEHGKGFAVVASEVKALASQTAAATEAIGQQINQMQAATLRSVDAIKGIGATIERNSAIAAAIAAAVEEQGAATQEITRAAQQAAHGTQGVFDAMQGVSAAVAETNDSVTALRGMSADVDQQGQALRREIAAFSDQLQRQAAAA